MAKFCLKCGQPLASGSRFCQACGAPVRQDEPQQGAQAAASTAPPEQPAQMQQAVPQQQQTVPQQTVPQQTVPQQTVPQQQAVPMQQAGQMPQGLPNFPPPPVVGPCMPDQGLVQKFFTYRGRLNRKPYAIRTVIMFILPLVTVSLLGSSQQGAGPAVLVSLASVISCVMLAVRRLNDMGKPAYLAGLLALPLVAGFISPAKAATFSYISIGFAIYLAAVEGMKGANQHGPDPLSGPENEW